MDVSIFDNLPGEVFLWLQLLIIEWSIKRSVICSTSSNNCFFFNENIRKSWRCHYNVPDRKLYVYCECIVCLVNHLWDDIRELWHSFLWMIFMHGAVVCPQSDLFIYLFSQHSMLFQSILLSAVFRQGDIGTSWYAVLSGSLDVKVSETANHQVRSGSSLNLELCTLHGPFCNLLSDFFFIFFSRYMMFQGCHFPHLLYKCSLC